MNNQTHGRLVCASDPWKHMFSLTHFMCGGGGCAIQFRRSHTIASFSFFLFLVIFAFIFYLNDEIKNVYNISHALHFVSEKNYHFSKIKKD